MAEVRRRTKSKFVSRPEKQLLKFVREHFPGTKSQVRLLGQSIDMYISELDVYVQLDGVYWHGLDESVRKNRVIKKKMSRDDELNSVFRGSIRGPKLFRISDKQWIYAVDNDHQNDVLKAIIESRSGLVIYDGTPGYLV
jgi:hypothetical protein